MEIKYPILKKPTIHNSSGLNYEELWEFYPEFFDKCSKICLGGAWKGFAVNLVKNVLEYLEDWDSISWKQFTSVMTMQPYRNKGISYGTKYCELNKDEWLYVRDEVMVISPKQDKIPTTDYQIDTLYKRIFNKQPIFYEECEKGMTRSYDKYGKRIFLL
jgi:hypothetical protein